MSRIVYISLIVIALLALAAVGWILSVFRPPVEPQPSLRSQKRRERPVQSLERSRPAIAHAFLQANGLPA